MERLGVVLPVPEPAAGEIRGLQRALGSRSRLGPHLTLVPPVNAAVDGAAEVVRRAAAALAPVRLGLGPAATFWPDTPVVYLAVSGDVTALGRLREAVFAPPLRRSVTRPFVPHVTLCEQVAEDRIVAAVSALSDYTAPVVCGRVHLLREDARGGWDVAVDAPLGGPRVVGRGGLEVALTHGDELDAEGRAFLAWAWTGHLVATYGPGSAARRAFAVTARREGAVVGVALGATDDELWLDRLVVDPGARRQGLGAHLLGEVEALGRAAGCERGLLVCPAGSPAEAFYRSRGWRVDLELPGWRHATDFVRLERLLPR